MNVNPLGKYAPGVSAILAVFWIVLTGIMDSGLIKGDTTLLNPVAIGILGVIFGTAVATATVNGNKAALAALNTMAVQHTAQIQALTSVTNCDTADNTTAMNANTVAVNANTDSQDNNVGGGVPSVPHQ